MASSYEYDDDDSHVFGYLLTFFFAWGIYLVWWRWHSFRNRAIPFRHPAPHVRQIGPTFQATRLEGASLKSHEQYPDLRPPGFPPERKCITAFDPSTGFHLATMLADSKEEITEKIARADRAQKAWRQTSFTDRRRVVRSLKKWLVDNQETCAKVACRDTGKTLLDAALGEILTTCSKMDWLLAHGERVLRPETRYNNLLMFYKKSQVHYEPLGVVAAIVSWNYPLHNAWSPILAALFAGDAIVVKCSEHVIWSTSWFVGAIMTCLQACGHSPDLVQLVCCYPEEADALTRSSLIRHITFIGSEEVGRKVAMAATENLTPVTLELGGKDPAILLPSTDLKRWSSILMRGIFQNAGQNCIGIERVIVHSSQYNELYEMMCERAGELRLGSALSQGQDGVVPNPDCGAMISPDRFDDLERVINDAEDHGAVFEVGGHRYEHQWLEHGSYFLPTVIGNVDPRAEIAQREMFAPIALIIKYDTIEEAIALANGTRYGLGASVFGPDTEKCMYIAKQLECGMVSINDFGVFYVSPVVQDLPFGGMKASGYGRFGGPEGLRSLTNPKAIVVDRFGWLVSTSIPRPVDYPIRSMAQSWQFISGLIGFVYAEEWRTRIESLMGLIRASKQ
ncbi:meiotic sister-chromatid recombination aldehyde dehydrogenase [Obba rivulosa]|uniref:Meiotic sister-chromatid recombination aldehyde dehydrogenase n=1 Tax=Obba rivulosa TaxID=1052685 RepID=A0A8E2AS07_9APHY|nr:meiotic sister-chromatid recombination aldehyde dehydrogenase [Obba rivulosa]